MERVVAENGVVFYRSKIIPCIHGFSTRLGGVSVLPHTASLNLGVDRGDSTETVIENLGRFANALGIDAEGIISVSQIHSVKIRRVDASHRGEGFYKKETEACDGYFSFSPQISLGVRTADCVPVLLYAEKKDGSSAVAALHAGWRGTAGGIVKSAVEEFLSEGFDADTVRAAIGPAIGRCCYTVKNDFYATFLEAAGKKITDEFVHPVADGVWAADLKGANKKMLEVLGVLPENIDVSSECTCCNSNEFFSHRYSHGHRGTMLSVIANVKR